MKRFGLIGFGKMGHALLGGMASVLDVPVTICDVSQDALSDAHAFGLKDVETTTDPDVVSETCDIVLLAVKPAQASKVLQRLAGGCAKTILSIVAGLTIEFMRALVSHPVVRIMPNTPALVGAASIVIVDQSLSPEVKALTTRLFSTCGQIHYIPQEKQLDAVTGLSGSGPAIFAVIAESLADAGVAEGLPRSLALALARETMLGTAKLMEKEHPAILKENVMSPGGTTAAGILAAEKAGIRAACEAFVSAATQKSRQL